MRMRVDAMPIFAPIAEHTPNAFNSIISLTLFITSFLSCRRLRSTMQNKEINNHIATNLISHKNSFAVILLNFFLTLKNHL